MTEAHQKVTISQQLARKLLPLALVIGFLISFVIPVTYCALDFRRVALEAHSFARRLAADVRQLAGETPGLWKYQANKYAQLISAAVSSEDRIRHILVLDENEKPVSRYTSPSASSQFEAILCIHGDPAPIIFNNRRIGEVRVGVSAYAILVQTLLSFLACAFIGVILSVVVYRFPVGVAVKLEKKLLEYQETLEEKVEERTIALQEAAETARRLTEEAHAGSLAKSQFLANMSHEIRTPMNGVLGMAELLLHSELNEKQHHLAQTVLRSGRTLLGILNDILDYSKIEAGKLTLEKVDFDLRECVGEAVRLFAETAHQKGIELVCHIAEGVPLLVEGDSNRLSQILGNLIGNAVKFTERGEVLIRVTCLENGGVDRLCFEIRDTGIGIPLEVQENVFQAFSQADSTTTRRFGGTGLGLSICRQLVAMMGGHIMVASQPGTGSTFRFTLPMKPRISPQPVSLPQPAALKAVRVLIVDDNATCRDMLCRQVSSWCTVKGSAADAREALELLRSAAAAGSPYGLAILDSVMPGMDGSELASAIKADPAIDDLPLIMLTPLGDDRHTKSPQCHLVASYLSKPVIASLLYNCILSATKIVALPAPREDTGQPVGTNVPPLPGARILLAEDNPVNQEVARYMLLNLGCSVEVASNGKEAVEALSRSPFDLVLMDCQMPVMDGFTATQIIRDKEAAGMTYLQKQGREFGRLPVIALTARAMQGDRERCLQMGMDDYLPKPFDLHRLLTLLKHWLPSSARE